MVDPALHLRKPLGSMTPYVNNPKFLRHTLAQFFRPISYAQVVALAHFFTIFMTTNAEG